MIERYEAKYHGFRLVADHWKGKYQGRAYFGSSGDIDKNKTISASGLSIESVVSQLRDLVDSLNQQEGRDHVQLHKEYLDQIGKKFKGYIDGEMPRNDPSWKCYKCEAKFNSFQGLRCVVCGAESCPHCGTCHCGYLGQYKY